MLWLLLGLGLAGPVTDAFQRHIRVKVDATPTTESIAEARTLNDAGMDAHKAKDWAGAAAMFEKAIGRDPTYAKAHYNLACVYSLQMTEALTLDIASCGEPAPASALWHLARSVELDPDRQVRMREDSDLENLRHFLSYAVIDGRDLSDPKVLRETLKDTKYWGNKPGAYPAPRLVLHADGTATKMVIRGDYQQTKVMGAWAVTDEGTVLLSFEGRASPYTVDPNKPGVLSGDYSWLPDGDACSA